MGVLNTMLGDAFNIIALTEAINILPVQNLYLGRQNVFKFKGVDTLSVMLEYKQNQLTLIPFAQRGELGSTPGGPSRVVRTFSVPHLPLLTSIPAHELIGVRQFGSPDQMETIDARIEEELATHKANHEQTWEFLRASALCGLLRDPVSGATLTNFYTEFGLVEETFTFAFSSVAATAEADLQLKCIEVKNAVGMALGGEAMTGVGAIIDDVFFQNMLKSPGVRAAWSDQMTWRRSNISHGEDVFEWGGITWTRYRAAGVGSVNFFGGTNVARFYPIGGENSGLYKHYGAPANFTAAVNTIGLPTYASQKVMDHDMGVEIHTQSNPLMFCSRPGSLKKGVST